MFQNIGTKIIDRRAIFTHLMQKIVNARCRILRTLRSADAIHGIAAEFFLDAEQPVVFGGAVGAGE